MASLVLLKGGEALEYQLNDGECTLGRHPDCTIQLDSNMVSRHHARIIPRDDAFFLEDLGSGNGTLVNGKRVLESVLLQDDDRIKLGPLLLRFQDTASPRTGEPVPAFDLDITGEGDDDDDPGTIMGTLTSKGLFGQLEVRPEAKLDAILQISRSLAGTIDLDSLLPKILDTLFTVFPHADRGMVMLKDPVRGNMIPKAIKHRLDDQDESVKISRTILNKVLAEKTGILSADAATDVRFEASESISNLTIRSMMCVPLLGLDGEPMGVINIDTQNPFNQFKNEDLDLLMAVAGQAALSYDNARLLVSHMEKEKQDGEMSIARNVQKALLPEQMPDIPGYQFYASYEAAQAVGGDYFDVIRLSDRKICLAFGDVAGKGVPASLVMSRLSSAVQSTMQFVSDGVDAVNRINNHMCNRACEGRFVTFVLTIIDLKTNKMQVVNAGHMSPIIRKPDGSFEEFPEEAIGVPIGVLEDFEFTATNRTIAPGETVVIYTDGVSEAMDHDSTLYGLDHLREFVCQGPADPAELGQLILVDVKRHANGRPQNDDITLMSFGRLSDYK